jgi:hypothetical protein
MRYLEGKNKEFAAKVWINTFFCRIFAGLKIVYL